MTATKQFVGQVDVSDMQLVVSDVSDLCSGMAEVWAVIQASHTNDPLSNVSTNASSSFGRSGHPPHKNTKGKLLSDGSSSSFSAYSVYDSDYSDDNSFYTAGSQEDDTC